MTSLIGEVEVLKTDTRGRVRVPAERREALLDEFEKSGMSGAKFARLAGRRALASGRSIPFILSTSPQSRRLRLPIEVLDRMKVSLTHQPPRPLPPPRRIYRMSVERRQAALSGSPFKPPALPMVHAPR